MRNKEFRKAIDCMLDKNDAEARKYIKEGIRQNPKYEKYREQLADMGFIFKKVDVPETTYNDIKESLKIYPVPVRLKILDTVYMEIKNENV